MKVTHVITQIGVGGAETSLATLIEASRDHGVEHVVVSMLSGGALRARLESAGANVIELGGQRGWRGGLKFGELINAIRISQPDIVQSWMYHPNLAMGMLALSGRLGIPCLWGIRQSIQMLSLEKPFTRIVVRGGGHLSSLSARIVYNSTEAAETHEALGYKRTRRVIIPNGIDCARFRPREGAREQLCAELELPGDVPLLGRVARKTPMKDYETLMRAFVQVRAAMPEARLLVIGPNKGHESEEINALAAALGCGDSLHILPPRLDMEEFYSALDIVVSSSSANEGFPNTIAEALACGTLVAATDVGEAMLIRSGAHKVVSPGDAPALAAAIGDLLRLPGEEKRRLEIQGRDFILAHFSAERFAEAFLQLWSEVLGRETARNDRVAA